MVGEPRHVHRLGGTIRLEPVGQHVIDLVRGGRHEAGDAR
ncbi:MAG: hypothetical protein QOK31_1124, partial [Solirubrobacteraceae bacterium]|nr:hypothetical protein [Solirubrobacteraceae bacterium]